TQGLFGLEFREQTTESSDITASSQFGLNGTVEINDFGIDPSSGLVELPTQVSDRSQQIAAGCSSQDRNTFIVTGRGGIPHNPHSLMNLNGSWLDLRNWSVSGKQSNSSNLITQVSNKPAIVEATGFIRNAKGEIELVASSPKPFKTPQISNCSEI
ncbi:MAG: S-layer family protein, partial [Cyanobacteria bacterium J06635_10]